jgi:hypothetical protein
MRERFDERTAVNLKPGGFSRMSMEGRGYFCMKVRSF